MDPLYRTPATCRPWWTIPLAHANGRPSSQIIKSGCGTSGGNVTCSPAAMAQAAGTDLESYTLARYIASEVGSGPPEEKVAVAEAAVNRVKLERLSSVLNLLLYRQPSGHPNRGYYGPIHGGDGISSAPYGRWAATSRDPTRGDIDVARMVLAGRTGNFSRGADDQLGAELLADKMAGSVRYNASKRNYWVGPLPGVDHWHLFLYTKRADIDPASALGQALIARGLAAVNDRTRPNWSSLGVCSSPASQGLAAAAGVLVGAGLGYLLAPTIVGKIVPSIWRR